MSGQRGENATLPCAAGRRVTFEILLDHWAGMTGDELRCIENLSEDRGLIVYSEPVMIGELPGFLQNSSCIAGRDDAVVRPRPVCLRALLGIEPKMGWPDRGEPPGQDRQSPNLPPHLPSSCQDLNVSA